jgi:hypothetical protein
MAGRRRVYQRENACKRVVAAALLRHVEEAEKTLCKGTALVALDAVRLLGSRRYCAVDTLFLAWILRVSAIGMIVSTGKRIHKREDVNGRYCEQTMT